MDFSFIPYNSTYASLVDSWLDTEAMQFTGIDDGWQSFFNYWNEESKKSAYYKDFCFIISVNSINIGVIYIGTDRGKAVISEFILSPSWRNKGFGCKILKDIVNNYDEIMNITISSFSAVIYSENIASQKAFEKAGFKHTSTQPDGDALNYIIVLN